ncbi:MAG: hypothetical protein MJZ90_10370 [Bacteroidales bacterium]|nr:hypothetical protein [Bacteroidales bacterium]
MKKKKYIVENYLTRLRNRSVRSYVIMTLYQMACDMWSDFRNDEQVRATYSSGKIKEVAEILNDVSRKIKSNFKKNGIADEYDNMMDDVANKSDELQHIASRFRDEIQTVFVRYIPYSHCHAYAMAIATGTMLLLANDTFVIASGEFCKYFGDATIKIDQLLNQVTPFQDPRGCCDNAVADRLYSAVLKSAEDEVGGKTNKFKPIGRDCVFRTASTDFLDRIAKKENLKPIGSQ